MVLVGDTLSCHDDHLCQIVFKSHHVRLSYGPYTILKYTNTQTHPPPHTHGQGKLYMPFRHFMAGHKKSKVLTRLYGFFGLASAVTFSQTSNSVLHDTCENKREYIREAITSKQLEFRYDCTMRHLKKLPHGAISSESTLFAYTFLST